MDYIKPGALIFLAILLAGCAPTPPPTQALNLPRVPTGDVISIQRFPYGGPKPSMFFVFKDDYDCYGIEPQQSDSIDELVIERKVFTTVMAQWKGIGTAPSCVVIQTFITGVASEFEVVAAAVDPETNTCSLEVNALSEDGKWKPVYSYYREPVDPFWPEYGRYCKPRELYQGSSLLLMPRGSK